MKNRHNYKTNIVLNIIKCSFILGKDIEIQCIYNFSKNLENQYRILFSIQYIFRIIRSVLDNILQQVAMNFIQVLSSVSPAFSSISLIIFLLLH